VPAVPVRSTLQGVGRWLSGQTPRAILLVGWVLALIYAFPGIMTMDSLDQLREARDGVLTDGHPPALAAIIHVVDAIISGPFGMLLIQTSAFLVGAYWILRRALPPRAAALAACLVLLYPPVLAPMAVIWKDCLMAGMFLLGAGAQFSERRWAKLAGLACIGVATAVRYNAFAAAMPLIVLLVAWPGITGWRRYALATTAWLALTFGSFALNAALTDIPMHFWHSSLAVLDITGTLARVDGPLPDDELRTLFAGTGLRVDHDIQAALKQRYELCREHGMDFEPLISAKEDTRLWDLPIFGTTPAPEAQRDAIERVFWAVVRAHPAEYAAHRMATMAEVVGLSHHPIGNMVPTFHTQYRPYMERLHLASEWSPLQDDLQRRIHRIAKKTPLFRVWVYIVIALVLVPFAIRRRQLDSLALLLSGLGLEASLVPLAPTPDYRYSHWLITCTVLALILIVARRAQWPHAPNTPAPAPPQPPAPV